ncbi:hypothetical protein HDU96_009382, partial [Phlyctochytrium bullatum]
STSSLTSLASAPPSPTAAPRLARLSDAQLADLAAQVSAERFRRRSPAAALVAAYAGTGANPAGGSGRLVAMSDDLLARFARDLDDEARRRDLPGVACAGDDGAGGLPAAAAATFLHTPPASPVGPRRVDDVAAGGDADRAVWRARLAMLAKDAFARLRGDLDGEVEMRRRVGPTAVSAPVGRSRRRRDGVVLGGAEGGSDEDATPSGAATATHEARLLRAMPIDLLWQLAEDVDGEHARRRADAPAPAPASVVAAAAATTTGPGTPVVRRRVGTGSPSVHHAPFQPPPPALAIGAAAAVLARDRTASSVSSAASSSATAASGGAATAVVRTGSMGGPAKIVSGTTGQGGDVEQLPKPAAKPGPPPGAEKPELNAKPDAKPDASLRRPPKPLPVPPVPAPPLVPPASDAAAPVSPSLSTHTSSSTSTASSLTPVERRELDLHVAAWRRKLGRLTDEQVAEVTTDVHDEMARRRDRAGACLPARQGFSERRNQARRQLAALPTHEIKLLWKVLHENLRERFEKVGEEEDEAGADGKEVNEGEAPKEEEVEEWKVGGETVEGAAPAAEEGMVVENQEKEKAAVAGDHRSPVAHLKPAASSPDFPILTTLPFPAEPSIAKLLSAMTKASSLLLVLLAPTLALAKCPLRCMTMDYRPVCASNGRTYNNPCQFEAAQCTDPTLTVSFKGTCEEMMLAEPMGPPKQGCEAVPRCSDEEKWVCGSDGESYINDCWRWTAHCENAEKDVVKVAEGKCVEEDL